MLAMGLSTTIIIKREHEPQTEKRFVNIYLEERQNNMDGMSVKYLVI